MAEGWIKLHRKIQEGFLWNEKPFDKARAWIDILLMANHAEKKVMLGTELITVDRGSFITSEVKLMERWGWSKSKLRNFLNVLEVEQMLVKKSDKKKTTLTVLNYSLYQELENQKKTTKRPQKDHAKTMQRPQKDTNKNEKNEKNEKNIKNIYAEFVSLTEEEYEKLISIHGEDAVKKMISILDNYKGSSGKKYTSDYRAILNWVVDRYTKDNQQQKNAKPQQQQPKKDKFNNFPQTEYNWKEIEELDMQNQVDNSKNLESEINILLEQRKRGAGNA